MSDSQKCPVAVPFPNSWSRRRYLRAAMALPVVPALAGCDGWFGMRHFDPDTDSGVSYQQTIQDGQSAIREAMAQTATSSVSVALLDGRSVVWQEAFGPVDQQTGALAAHNTLYNIGSCSKVLAATSVMILVDRGLVGLDTPAARYLPGFRMQDSAYANITVRMLLSHSSGLPGSSLRNIFLFRAWSDYGRAAEAAQSDLNLKAAPGAYSVYCNDGFTLAQRLVEEVSGKPYPQFVHDEIFVPLGMSLSRYPTEPYPAGSFAHSVLNGQQWGQEFVLAYGTGGASSTPGDMLRLAQMFFQEGELDGKRILSAQSVREMARDQARSQPLFATLQFAWGLGWDSVAQPGLAAVGIPCWEKNGGTTLYGSDFFVLPQHRMALMITGTSTAYGAGALAERILLNALVERKTLSRMPTKLVAPPATTAISEAQAAEMLGVYGSFVGTYRVVRDSSQTLALEQWQKGRWQALATQLRDRGDGWCANREAPQHAYRARTVDDVPFLLTHAPAGYGHYALTVPMAQRLQPRSPLSSAWQRRIGQRWLLVNEDWSSVALAVEGTTLTLEAVPDLPGYVVLDGLQPVVPSSDTRTKMVLTIPVVFGRDLRELQIVSRQGQEWILSNGQWYRPQEGTPSLMRGQQVVQIDRDGFTEWRHVLEAGRVSVQGDFAAWKLYDSDFTLLDSGEGTAEFMVAAGQYVALFGEAGVAGTLVLA